MDHLSIVPTTLAKLHPSHRVGDRNEALTRSKRSHGSHRLPLRTPDRMAEHSRPYMKGDSLRKIDWKVFARSDELIVRQHQETASVQVSVFVDLSSSMNWPSKQLVDLEYIEKSQLIKAEKAETQIFNITVGNKKRNVLFKAVQYHPVTDEIMHVDLYGIKMDQMVSVHVVINIHGTAKGVVEGGIVVQALSELEIECLPMDIPKSIDVDVSELEIGDNIKVEGITTDDKVMVKSNPEQIIVSITQAMKEEELIPQVDEDEELLEGEEGEEGEEGTTETSEDTQEDKSTDKDNKQDKEG